MQLIREEWQKRSWNLQNRRFRNHIHPYSRKTRPKLDQITTDLNNFTLKSSHNNNNCRIVQDLQIFHSLICSFVHSIWGSTSSYPLLFSYIRRFCESNQKNHPFQLPDPRQQAVGPQELTADPFPENQLPIS